MDKYEFNIKVEQIKKMMGQGDYGTAMKIADTIDWRRVRNVNILSMVATIYEKNQEYQEAKDILLLAFERAPIGKRLLYKLAELAIKEGSVQEAEDYYREFCELAPDDPRQYILRYLILGAKGAPVEQLIHTLEQYCNIELDEKWLYELAELYNEAGMSELCVLACDKIMLMFGLGKYVDKAMELKIQHAPLNKYQMDLVENRDKYEEKLKAVEQEYRMGRRPLVEPVSREAERSFEEDDAVYQARQEASYTREPEEAYQEDMYDTGDQDEYRENEVDDQSGYGRRSGYFQQPSSSYEGYPDTYPDEELNRTERYREGTSEYEETYQEYSESYTDDYQEESREEIIEETVEPEHTEVTIESEDPEWESSSENHLSEDHLKAHLHEAEIQANLAKEMSRISKSPEFKQEAEAAQTRVLTDIRELNQESFRRGASHLMIEAEDAGKGLELAVDTLRKIHQETGTKSQAAKITGEKLNRRGIFTISDKLTGKDLIIEKAGDMNEAILQELNQLMARDETGMNIVLIDTAERLKELHQTYPGLAKRFECIGTSDVPKELPQEKPKKAVQPVKASQSERPIYRKSETLSQNQPAKPKPVSPQQSRPQPPAQERMSRQYASQTQQSEHQVTPAVRPQANSISGTVRKLPADQPVSAVKTVVPAKLPAGQESGVSTGTGQHKTENRPIKHVKPTEKQAQAIPVIKKIPDKQAAAPAQDIPIEDDTEMDIDEFAQYACQYASDIDCSISGKSMLALYERIEIMEEDGVPLTKANAEDLIEEAADKAENPSFLKRITGIFSSKYDKEGLLILKEEHFL